MKGVSVPMLTTYCIRVNQSAEYDVTTALGDTEARTIAFLMDGGAGTEYTDDTSVEALALECTEIIAQIPV